MTSRKKGRSPKSSVRNMVTLTEGEWRKLEELYPGFKRASILAAIARAVIRRGSMVRLVE